MTNYESFINAIHTKKVVSMTFNSQEKGIITRACIPFDYGPSKKYKDGLVRYHLYDLNSPDGIHNLSILPEQVISIEILNREFQPSDYVHWKPNWFIKRDWGEFS